MSFDILKSLQSIQTWLIILLVLSITVSLGYGAPTNKKDAQNAVSGWLNLSGRPLKAKMAQDIQDVTEYLNDAGDVIYYVVSMKPEGYVVISPDDLIEPIIAFSPVGTYDPDPQNPLYALVSSDLPQRLKHVKELEAEAIKTNIALATPEKLTESESKWKQLTGGVDSQEPVVMEGEPIASADEPILMSSLSTIDDIRVDVLVQSRWNQSTVNGSTCYNYYTPYNYYCGCAATALAQILRFHEHPTAGVDHTQPFDVTVDGGTAQGGEDITTYLRGGDDAGGPYVWADMPLVPDSSTTEAQRQAIGRLTVDAGSTVNMNYTSDGSSASISDSADALRDVFGYSNAIGTYEPAALEGNGFNEMVNPNLDAGLPVMLGISGDGGHSILCDGYGYNTLTLYHHLNMGWGGAKDAWYNIPDLDTDWYSYNTVLSCVYNIFTNGTGEIISGRVVNGAEEPQSGIPVTADDGANQYTDVTDSNGIYAITRVPSATLFTLSCPGAPTNNVTTGTSVDAYQGAVGNLWGENLTVTMDQPYIAVNPVSLTPSCAIGTDAATQTFTICNVGVDTLGYFITKDQTWLSVSPTSGTSTGEEDTITVTYSTSGLSGGTYNANITITDAGAGNSPITIPVTLTVIPPLISTSETSLFPVCQVGRNATSQTFTVSNSGGATLNYSISDNQIWLSVSPTSGTSTGEENTLTVTYNTTGLAEGSYNANITITDGAAGNSPITVPVELTVIPVCVYYNNLNTNPGFTTTGSFEFGVPSGENKCTSAYTGINIYDTDLDTTCWENSTLTTQPIDCSGHTNVGLEFYASKYIYTGYTIKFEVSNDGSSWTELYSVTGTTASQWAKHTYDISAVADGQSTVYVCWSMTGSGSQYTGGGLAIDDVMITGDSTTLTYSVTYNENTSTGGSVPIDPTSYEEAATVTVLGNTGSLVKTGYTFAGWNTQSGGGGTTYAADATFNITANTTLYAQWTINQYTITFDSDGGSAVTAITQDFGSTVTAPAAPTKSGYAFAGWSPELLGTMPVDGVDVTAQWKKNVSSLTIADVGPFTYNGLAQTPTPEVKDGETVLTKDTDYTLSYSNNTNVGTATVTVTGTENYTGTQDKTFEITQATPTATDDITSVDEDGSIVIDVLVNDSDGDGDPLTISGVTQGNHGAVENGATNVTYTPVGDYNGADSFDYVITDEQGGMATGTVSVTVNSVNDLPTIGLLTPTNGATVAIITNLQLIAVSSDVDGTVSEVRFYYGVTNPITTTTMVPTSVVEWVGAPIADVFLLSAVATDDDGGSVTSATITVTVDSDGDDMPDGWENDNGLDRTNLNDRVLSDTDEDGMSDYAEYIAGTLPNNGNSILKFEDIAVSNAAECVLGFMTVTDRLYTIEWCVEVDGTWSNMTGELPGTGGWKSIADMETGLKRFYRIRVSKP